MLSALATATEEIGPDPGAVPPVVARDLQVAALPHHRLAVGRRRVDARDRPARRRRHVHPLARWPGSSGSSPSPVRPSSSVGSRRSTSSSRPTRARSAPAAPASSSSPRCSSRWSSPRPTRPAPTSSSPSPSPTIADADDDHAAYAVRPVLAALAVLTVLTVVGGLVLLTGLFDIHGASVWWMLLTAAAHPHRWRPSWLARGHGDPRDAFVRTPRQRALADAGLGFDTAYRRAVAAPGAGTGPGRRLPRPRGRRRLRARGGGLGRHRRLAHRARAPA